MNKTYKVTFFYLGEKDRNGKQKRDYLGASHIDIFPWDTLDVQSKAFRQATPRQQTANELEFRLVKVW